jgi:hypothetical protein
VSHHVSADADPPGDFIEAQAGAVELDQVVLLLSGKYTPSRHEFILWLSSAYSSAVEGLSITNRTAPSAPSTPVWRLSAYR